MTATPTETGASPFRTWLRRIVLPSDSFAVLKALFVALSLLALLRHASTHGFSDVLNRVVETYDSTLALLLSPVQPLLADLVAAVSGVFGLDLQLQDFWKHVFVLLTIYFFSRAAGSWGAGQHGTGAFRLCWGVLVALAFSVLASIDMGPGAGLRQDLRIALAAIGCIAVYELGMNVWFATFFREFQARLHGRAVRGWGAEFLHLSREDGLRILAGTALALGLLSLPWPGFVTRPELVVLALIVLLYGSFWVWWGWRQTRFAPDLAARLDAARNNGDIIVGTAMIRSFVYAMIAAVLDAAAGML